MWSWNEVKTPSLCVSDQVRTISWFVAAAYFGPASAASTKELIIQEGTVGNDLKLTQILCATLRMQPHV